MLAALLLCWQSRCCIGSLAAVLAASAVLAMPAALAVLACFLCCSLDSPSHPLPPLVHTSASRPIRYQVGNAYFARVLHTDVRGLRNLAVINNHFHMLRTRNVFSHVFEVPPREGQPPSAYTLEFIEVDDRLAADVLEARLAKEAKAAPRFAPGEAWQTSTPTLRELHDWVHMENSAYASSRLLQEREPIDPELLKSY